MPSLTLIPLKELMLRHLTNIYCTKAATHQECNFAKRRHARADGGGGEGPFPVAAVAARTQLTPSLCAAAAHRPSQCSALAVGPSGSVRRSMGFNSLVQCNRVR